jgi:hypothetical protein
MDSLDRTFRETANVPAFSTAHKVTDRLAAQPVGAITPPAMMLLSSAGRIAREPSPPSTRDQR